MTNLEMCNLLHKIQHTLLTIEQMLNTTKLKEKNMAVDPVIAALIEKFDAATNKIAARIQKLIDAGGLSVESVAALEAEVAKLEALGADPNNPVPA